MDFPQLTENFNLKEFIVSREHPDLADKIRLDMVANWSHDQQKLFEYKCYLLCRMYLQPIRDVYHDKIEILSGIRSEELNKAIGGVDSSDHLFEDESAAVDFTLRSIDSCANMLATSTWPLGQMIWYPEHRFIHLSLPTKNHFRNLLKKIDGKYYPFFKEIET